MIRDRPDACPGALQVHQAADGALARVRLPGGQLDPAQLQALANAAQDLGNGELELTVRGNIQLRAVSDTDLLAEQLAGAGLLPSATHERVRNIVASPLSGRIGGVVDVRDHVRSLDAALRAEPALARLPGRVLFSVDDGTGDVSGLSADFGLHAVSSDLFALILAGTDSGARVKTEDGVRHVTEAALTFVEARSDEWRLAELESGPEHVLANLGLTPTAERITVAPVAEPPIGWLPQQDGNVSLGAGVRLGILPARTAEFLAAIGRPIVITPWRSLLVTDLDEWTAEQAVRVLAPMDVIFDAESPWLRVSACTGRPGCTKALADVRADLTVAVEQQALSLVEHQHWAGCERRCGRPRGRVTDVVATEAGYLVSGADLEPPS
ncbi:precorrin-3B synthase [Antrihabitans sp. YC2-6]|uniref:precorrin-3B synthase n=1 Tax=Antrihabitans sp. YC2-6 TaxID=2799498 RepID=UPI0018F73222|nr:precorrin-3B synthase [Antrihabitans sp. YC2-6]MBJ8345574.1 precorrin-3B synthase [Antrihabitans sp. YC2-6]